VVGDYGNEHPFDLKRRLIEYEPLNGTSLDVFTGTESVTYNNYTPSLLDIAHEHIPMGSPPSNGALMSELLAKTNPSRPVVDLPVFFWELRELPSLVKTTGENLLKRSAGSYLSYEFGWKPLIGDLVGLMKFQDHFHKRETEISSILLQGGVKRRRSLRDDTFFEEDNRILLDTVGTTLRVNRTRLTRRRIWATTRWVPDSTRMPPKTVREIQSLARKAVLGLAVEPATLWQAMPWSWMIDWFSSAGDYLEAHRNTVPAIHQKGCVMTQTETYTNFFRGEGLDAGWPRVLGGSGSQYYVTKRRRVQVNPTIAAYFPFLSRRQVSILGALSVTRGGHRKR
jgi:hypothetical protein